MTEERGSIKREKKKTSLDFSDKGRNLHKINGERVVRNIKRESGREGKEKQNMGFLNPYFLCNSFDKVCSLC